MRSIDSGLWCWDATTQAASDDAPSQRRGWRGVLSFSFEVRMCQGRVTLPCKSLRGVRAPNRRPLWSVEGLCGARIVEDLRARGVAISNACWRERVGEAGACWTTPLVAVSSSSPADRGRILASGGEPLRVGGLAARYGLYTGRNDLLRSWHSGPGRQKNS